MVRVRDVAAGVGLGLASTVGLVALVYAIARPSLPSTIERATVAELRAYRLQVDRNNPLAAILADALGAEQLAALVGRIVKRVAEEKLP